MSKKKKSPATDMVDHAPNAIGWHPELTARLKTSKEFYEQSAVDLTLETVVGWSVGAFVEFKESKDFFDLTIEIDREVGYLIAGILALASGDFELAALNLWNAGLMDRAPEVVEEETVG